MSKQKYSAAIGENESCALGKALPISTKQSIEICSMIRNKKVDVAKKMLDEVVNFKRPVPFKRFTDGVGHKKGDLTSGRYPLKSCKHILALLDSASKNAEFKGLNTSNLFIKHINAHKGSGVMRHGRRSVEAKRTHVEIIVKEEKVNAK